MNKSYKINSSEVVQLEKGNITKLINNKSKSFSGFAEAYISNIKYKKIKAWKVHTKINCNLFILSGKIKFVLANYHKDEELIFKEYILQPKKNNHLFISHGVMFGFQGLARGDNSILNISNKIVSKEKVIRFDQNEFIYKKWL